MRCVADGVAVKNSIYLPSGVYGVWAVAGAVAWRPDGAMGNEHQRGGVTTRPGFVPCARAMPYAVACRSFRAGAVAWRPDGAMGPNELGIYGVGMGVGAMAVDVGCVCLRSYLPRRLSGRSAKAPPLMDASTSKV